jgi:cardiolipin synthase
MRTASLILLVLAVSAAPCALAETPAKPGLSDNLTDAGKVGLHLVRSHGLEAVHRPVSLVSRLGLLATYAVRDTGRELALRMVVKPALDGTPIPPLHQGPGMDLDAWESELDDIVGRRSRSSGRASMLIGGEAYFASLVSEIADARESIKMRTYIFDRDDYSLAMADFLKARSFEVETKVMFDGLGTILAERVAAESQPEIEREPLGITTYLLDGSAIKVRNLTNPWFTGDHVKTTIIDERVGFLGGMNIGREYRFDWHDLMVRLEGPVVADLSRNFDRKWTHSGSFGDLRVLGHWLKPRRSSQHDDGYPMRVITTKPQASDLYRAQRAAIHNAKGYIYIENPYLSDETLLNDLVQARLRGVDVRQPWGDEPQ